MEDFSLRNATILLLDSDSLTRGVLSSTLESAGYFVATAGNLGAAVDSLSVIHAELLMIAPYVDNMPAQQAAAYLRRRQPGLPVLTVVGLIDDDCVATRNEIGNLHTFPKPFSKDELLAAVSDVLKYEWEKRFVFHAPIGPVHGEFLKERRCDRGDFRKI